MTPILQIEHLTLGFRTDEGMLCAAEDVCLEVGAGEIVCLVGESGCGKSVTSQSVARLIPAVHCLGGRILLEGRDVLTLSKSELRRVRGRVVSYIFQDPGQALNPAMTIGAQILESLRLHQPAEASRDACIRALREVGIPSPEQRIDEYPHQLSGGMKQRAMIAMALASRPRLLIADEPTTALDVTIQAQILSLLLELRKRLGMSILLITHNLGIVAQVADRVAVMYAGRIVETGATAAVLERPAHPYTRALLASVPQLGSAGVAERLQAIGGQVPPLNAMPNGCRFHPRCPECGEVCRRVEPPLEPLLPAAEAGHLSRCHRR